MNFCPQCRTPLVALALGGRDRLSCPEAECGFVHWDNPVPVVAAVVEHEGRVVIARNAAWPEGKFGLITGFLERDETPEAGILREVEEELGLQGELAGFIGNYAFMPRNQLILAYHVRARGTIRLNEELVEVRRLLPEEIQPWELGTGPALRDWLARRTAAG